MLSDIRARHESLKSVQSTQSTKQMAELRSQAHKDRDWLLNALTECKSENRGLRRELQSLKARFDELAKMVGDAA